MTLVKCERVPSKVDSLGRQKYVKKLTLLCDECDATFVRSGSNITRQTRRKHHFCNNECANKSKLNGVIRSSIDSTNVDRYGHRSPLSSKQCQDKSKATCLEKYGHQYVGSVQQFIEERKATCLKKHGHESYLATKHARDRLNDPDVRQRRVESNKNVDWGVRNKKSHATMKKNGSYKTSKREDRFHERLINVVGRVERQASVNGWPIDFYLSTLDVYVQFDGAYWHGLDRPLDQIMKYKNNRDIAIHKKHTSDRRQDEWFETNGMKLVRFIDTEVSSLSNKDIIARLF